MKRTKNLERASQLQYRQGDVLLTRIDALPTRNQLQRIRARSGFVILAEGEVTSHVHKIAATAAMLLQNRRSERFLKVTAPTRLIHDEHNAIHLASGFYAVTRQREYHPLGNYTVGD